MLDILTFLILMNIIFVTQLIKNLCSFFIRKFIKDFI